MFYPSNISQGAWFLIWKLAAALSPGAWQCSGVSYSSFSCSLVLLLLLPLYYRISSSHLSLNLQFQSNFLLLNNPLMLNIILLAYAPRLTHFTFCFFPPRCCHFYLSLVFYQNLSFYFFLVQSKCLDRINLFFLPCHSHFKCHLLLFSCPIIISKFRRIFCVFGCCLHPAVLNGKA